jgi:hypothetical protein
MKCALAHPITYPVSAREPSDGRRTIADGIIYDALPEPLVVKFLGAALMLLAAEGFSPAQAQTIGVTAELSSSGPTIPSNFVGFSTEEYDIAFGQVYTPNNTSLISLLQSLGPNGVMRVGGSSSDNVPPDPITQDSLNRLSGFLLALGPGWNMIYGLNAAANDTNLAVTQAGYLLNTLPSNRVAFQVGNEPDFLYGSEQPWLTVFNNYYQALTAVYGQLNFGAPDTFGTFDGISWPNDTVLGAGGFEYLTAHKYTLGCNPEPLPSAKSVLADPILPSNPGWSITEFGIICDGGMQGVTDRLIAATYYLELAQSTASGGWAGIMPHNVVVPELWGDGLTRPAYYNQFAMQSDGGYAPMPMFYGQYLFSQIQGQQIIEVQTPQNYSSVASITATAGPNGNANILVVNINPRHGFYVRPDQNAPWQSANVLVLSGNSCADPSPVLNGQPIGEGGAWGGSVASINRGASVFVGSCGAALIRIQP